MRAESEYEPWSGARYVREPLPVSKRTRVIFEVVRTAASCVAAVCSAASLIVLVTHFG